MLRKLAILRDQLGLGTSAGRRFFIPLVEPDTQFSRIRIPEETSRFIGGDPLITERTPAAEAYLHALD